MRSLLILLVVVSCRPNFDSEGMKGSSSPSMIVVTPNQFYLDAAGGFKLHLKIAGQEFNKKKLQKSIFLVKVPTKERLEESDLDHAIQTKITKIDQENFQIDTKRAVESGVIYGLYFKHENSEHVELVRSFLILPKPPELAGLDSVSEDLNFVESDRLVFNFGFDQAIYLHNDQAIRLMSLDEPHEEIELESLTVGRDGKIIEVKRKQTALPSMVPGKKYIFLFGDGLKNQFGQVARVRPLEFSVASPKRAINELLPFALRTSHDAVEFNWALNQQHSSELVVSSFLNPVNGELSRRAIKQSSHRVLSQDDAWLHHDRLYVSGLKSDCLYRFILVNTDVRGRMISAVGSFKTRSLETMRISEVMINPHTLAYEKESTAEFIEIANIGNEAVELDGLRLSIEDQESLHVSVCELSTVGVPRLKRNGYALIVGHGFNKDHYDLKPGVLILRLAQKSLCGGLSNEKKKIIRLERQEGQLVDRYGGHKWHTLEGQSVQRIDLAGLDDDHNYCYSTSDVGATPGSINGPCGL